MQEKMLQNQRQGGEVEITQEMISEGASVLRSLIGVFDEYSLAAEVYRAMVRAARSQNEGVHCDTNGWMN
jgi:hypothetical protein